MTTENGLQAEPATLARLEQAEAFARHGDRVAAKTIYAEILHSDPSNFTVYLKLGSLYFGEGAFESAAATYLQAIKRHPESAEFHFNLGLAHQHLHKLEDAILNYDIAIGIHRDFAAAFYNRGFALQRLGRLQESIESYGDAIRSNPNYFHAYYNRGIALKSLGQLEPALASYERALQIKPDLPDLHLNRGLALQALNRLEQASQSYQNAIALDPNFFEAICNLGNVQKQNGQFELAVESFDRALRLKPESALAHSNRGVALEKMGLLSEAIVSHQRAISLNREFAQAHYNLGVAYQEALQLDQALACYEQALKLEPNLVVAQWNKSIALLLNGDFENGWSVYESRWTKPDGSSRRRSFSAPLWLGQESLAGKTILLYDEQGFGDSIQFCRYVGVLRDLQAIVLLEVDRALLGLFKSLDGVSTLVERGASLPVFDFHCPLVSLPLAFKTRINSIPAAIPYLQADPVKVQYWQQKLGPGSLLRVGLVWSGGFRSHQPESWSINQRRNLPVQQLAVLHDLPVQFYSLQKGEPACSEFRMILANGWQGPPLIDHTDELRDFSDTAALIENLDLVISVDTSTAHLASALGKPVWLLNRYNSCWRWLLERLDSPWYPALRLYRQDAGRSWEPVLQRIKRDLMVLTESAAVANRSGDRRVNG